MSSVTDQIPTCLPSLDKLVQRSRYDRLSVLAATTIILAHAHFDIPSDQVPYFMLQLFPAVISILANNYDNALKITIEVYIHDVHSSKNSIYLVLATMHSTS